MRRAQPVAVGLVAAGVIVAGSLVIPGRLDATAARPVHATREPVVDTGSFRRPGADPSEDPTCDSFRLLDQDGTSKRPVRVDPAPTSVDLLWLPGENAPCPTARTSAGAKIANLLAADVDGPPPVPVSGPHTCVFTNGAGAILFFHHAGTAALERVDISFSNCGGNVSAPGRSRTERELDGLPVSPLFSRHDGP